MADWKVPMSYSYSPSYHAYAYGLVCPPGSDNGTAGLGWAEATFGHTGVSGGYCTASPPKCPEDGVANTGDFPNSVLCFADTQGQRGRFFFPHNRTYHPAQQVKESMGITSEAAGDSEAHTPDSWSSASSSDGCLPKAPVPSWAEKNGEQQESGSPDSSEPVSSSLTLEEPPRLGMGNEEQPTPSTPFLQSPAAQATTAQPKKAKARTAFSEGQMSALTHRFNVQRYLTPMEMKTLARFTGLTYKQVKTWFQNRRMKLKRHQKESTWVSERYPNAGYAAGPPHSQFSTDMPALVQDQCSAGTFRGPTFAKSPSPMPGYYNSYPQPANSPQPPIRAPANWSLPPASYEYGPAGYNGIASCAGGDDATGMIDSPTGMVVVQNATQWAT